ncbi:MAG: CCA tRNA nucleotidyltransferase, partial [Thermoleophilia bacterium]|nr:CCA tRNA nucleotidyltransferase [Thermoleophilia bacterium]
AGIALGRDLVAALQGSQVAEHGFGTISVALGEIGIVDIATARTETYAAPGALPDVSYVNDMRLDLARRDVSANALALPVAAVAVGARQSDIVDETGGVRDIASRTLRVMHDASFLDDPTRIFRVLRYLGELDDFSLDAHSAGLLDAAVAAGALDTISPQRRANELRLTWQSPRVAEVMRLLSERGVTTALELPQTLVPAFGERAGLLADTSLDVRERCTLSAATLARTFATTADAERWFRAAELPGELMTAALAVSTLDRACDNYERVPASADSAQHRDALLVAALAAPDKVVRLVVKLHPLVELAQVLDDRASLEPQLSGYDLRELGVPDGPMMGRILGMVAAARRGGMLTTVADEQRLVHELLALSASNDEANKR